MGDIADDHKYPDPYPEDDESGFLPTDGDAPANREYSKGYPSSWDRVKPSGPGPCPKCGSATVLRTGRKGKFFGCVKYPECTGTRDGGKDERQPELPFSLSNVTGQTGHTDGRIDPDRELKEALRQMVDGVEKVCRIMKVWLDKGR